MPSRTWLWARLATLLPVAVVGAGLWIGLADRPAAPFLMRFLDADHEFLRTKLQMGGVRALLAALSRAR
jgi:hypothetical protein